MATDHGTMHACAHTSGCQSCKENPIGECVNGRFEQRDGAFVVGALVQFDWLDNRQRRVLGGEGGRKRTQTSNHKRSEVRKTNMEAGATRPITTRSDNTTRITQR